MATSTRSASRTSTSRTRPAAKKRARTSAAPSPAAIPAPAAPAPAPAPRKPRKADKSAAKASARPVRDSFTMPAPDFALIAVLKERAVAFRRPAKKSELLRAGLHALAALDDQALRRALDALTPVKSGRPKKA